MDGVGSDRCMTPKLDISLNHKKPKVRVNRLVRTTPARGRKQRLQSFNTSSSSITKCKKSLKLNNRALAQALEQARSALALQQSENITLNRKLQLSNERLNQLNHVASLKNEEIEAEVHKRVQERLAQMTSLLNRVTHDLVGTVDVLGDAVRMCSNATPSGKQQGQARTSSGQESDGITPLPASNQRTIYYTGNKEAGRKPSKNSIHRSPTTGQVVRRSQTNKYEETATTHAQRDVIKNLSTFPTLSERTEGTAASDGEKGRSQPIDTGRFISELQAFQSVPRVLNTNLTTEQLLLESNDVITAIQQSSSNPSSPHNSFPVDDQTVLLSEDMDFTEVFNSSTALLMTNQQPLPCPLVTESTGSSQDGMEDDNMTSVDNEVVKCGENAAKASGKKKAGPPCEDLVKATKSKQKKSKVGNKENHAEPTDALSDLDSDSASHKKTNFQVHLSKLGKISFAAGRKDTGMQVIKDSKLPKARSKPSKSRSKSRAMAVSNQKTLPSETDVPVSVFDYEGTPTDKRMKVYDVSLNESVSPKRPTLGEFRQQVLQIPETPVVTRSAEKSREAKRKSDSESDSPVLEKRARTKTISKPKVLAPPKSAGSSPVKNDDSVRTSESDGKKGARSRSRTITVGETGSKDTATSEKCQQKSGRSKTRVTQSGPRCRETFAVLPAAVDEAKKSQEAEGPKVHVDDIVGPSDSEGCVESPDRMSARASRSKSHRPSSRQEEPSQSIDNELAENRSEAAGATTATSMKTTNDAEKTKSKPAKTKLRATFAVPLELTEGEMFGDDGVHGDSAVAEASVIIQRKTSRSKSRGTQKPAHTLDKEMELLADNLPFCNERRGQVCVGKRVKVTKKVDTEDDLEKMFESDVSLLEEYAKPPELRKTNSSTGTADAGKDDKKLSVSSVQSDTGSSDDSGRRSRRAGKAVSYAEPRLGSKLRQGDPGTSTIYEGKEKPVFTLKSTGKKSSTLNSKRSALSVITNTEHSGMSH